MSSAGYQKSDVAWARACVLQTTAAKGERGAGLAHSAASKGPELILAHHSMITKPYSEVYMSK